MINPAFNLAAAEIQTDAAHRDVFAQVSAVRIRQPVRVDESGGFAKI